MRLNQFTFYFHYFIACCILLELVEYQYLCPLLTEASDYGGLYNEKITIQNIREQSESHLIELSKLLFLNYPLWNTDIELQLNLSPHILNLITQDIKNINCVLQIMLDLKNYKS
jgi:hypothetical protein